MPTSHKVNNKTKVKAQNVATYMPSFNFGYEFFNHAVFNYADDIAIMVFGAIGYFGVFN